MRRPDWPVRLHRYIESVRRNDLRYGRFDCALFVAGAVEAMTGCDPAAEHRGRYRTRAGGLSRVRAAGHQDHVAMVAALFAEVPPSFAAVGDIAVIASDEGDALGIVQREMVIVLAKGGIGMVPILSATRAFRV